MRIEAPVGRTDDVAYESDRLLAADDGEVLDHLGRLLASKEVRQRLGRCGRSHIAKYDWDLITKQWKKFSSAPATRVITGEGCGFVFRQEAAGGFSLGSAD